MKDVTTHTTFLIRQRHQVLCQVQVYATLRYTKGLHVVKCLSPLYQVLICGLVPEYDIQQMDGWRKEDEGG